MATTAELMAEHIIIGLDDFFAFVRGSDGPVLGYHFEFSPGEALDLNMVLEARPKIEFWNCSFFCPGEMALAYSGDFPIQMFRGCSFKGMIHS